MSEAGVAVQVAWYQSPSQTNLPRVVFEYRQTAIPPPAIRPSILSLTPQPASQRFFCLPQPPAQARLFRPVYNKRDNLKTSPARTGPT